MKVIAIDGPAAAGKGTIAIQLASRLKFNILPSGSIYRAIALLALRRNTDTGDEAELLKLIPQMELRFEVAGETLKIFLGQESIEQEILSNEIGETASRIAVFPGVRQALLETQRSFAAPPGLVAEGRDMGTVVFPDAYLKIFLSATLEERAARRFRQLQQELGEANKTSLEEIATSLAERDKTDSTREYARLEKATDATEIDTTGLGVAEVVEKILENI